MSSPSDAAPAPVAPSHSTAMLEAAELAASMVDDCMNGYDEASLTIVGDHSSSNSCSNNNTNDDDAMMTMMMSMEQLLDDAGVVSGGGDSTYNTTSGAASKASAMNVALEPSIVSGTTDLFEGDLCDDELDEIPSILMPNGSKGGYYENLQLNPVELVEEVQEQIAHVAASDPACTPTSRDPGAASVPTPAPATTSSKAAGSTINLKRPVVPFVVRKLSDAEEVGNNKKRPPTPVVSSLPKKARVSTAASVVVVDKVVSGSDGGSSHKVIKEEPRMTRSRAKKAPAVRKAKPKVVSSKSTESPTTSTAKAPNGSKSNVPQKAITTTAATPKTDIARGATKDIVKLSVSAKNDRTVGTVNSSGNTSPTDEVIAAGKARDLPVVTPVETDKAVSAKQLSIQNKMTDSVGSITLPALYTAITTKAGSSGANISKNETTSVTTISPPKKDAISGPKPPPVAATVKVTPTPSKRSSRRSSKSVDTTPPVEPPVPVDTSTAHIQALTGENGASVCLSIRSCTLLASSLDAAEDAAANSAKANTNNTATATTSEATTTEPDAGEDIPPRFGQSPMTEEERAQQSRDRNRKHARNTRLRKKAYVEELKQTLNELVIQRERAASEEQQNRQREVDQREVRFRVIEEFLKLRGRNETDVSRWTAILAPTFSFSLPLTPFQEMVDSEETKDRIQTLTGVENLMRDSSNLSTFLQTLGGVNGENAEEEELGAKKVTLVYCCDRKDFMMDACNAVLGWNALSVGVIAKGAPAELSFRGSLRAHFCPESNRLRSLDMVFDTGTILSQRDELAN